MSIGSRLLPGLRISLGACRWEGRIELSPGTSPAPAGYEPDAAIPRRSWRALRAEELERLRPDGSRRAREREIALLRVPAGELSRFRALRAATAASRGREDVYPVVASSRCESGMEAFRRFARKRYGREGGAREDDFPQGGIRVNDPGLATTTESRVGGVFVGLHVDNYSRLPLDASRLDANRICVNLGSQDRFLLFMNLPIDRISAAARRAGFSREAAGTTTARAFFRSYPAYPVLRLRVRPGEAYIAPTEYMVHDASTLGMTVPDVSLSLRGRFAARAPR